MNTEPPGIVYRYERCIIRLSGLDPSRHLAFHGEQCFKVRFAEMDTKPERQRRLDCLVLLNPARLLDLMLGAFFELA